MFEWSFSCSAAENAHQFSSKKRHHFFTKQNLVKQISHSSWYGEDMQGDDNAYIFYQLWPTCEKKNWILIKIKLHIDPTSRYRTIIHQKECMKYPLQLSYVSFANKQFPQIASNWNQAHTVIQLHSHTMFMQIFFFKHCHENEHKHFCNLLAMVLADKSLVSPGKAYKWPAQNNSLLRYNNKGLHIWSSDLQYTMGIQKMSGGKQKTEK